MECLATHGMFDHGFAPYGVRSHGLATHGVFDNGVGGLGACIGVWVPIELGDGFRWS